MNAGDVDKACKSNVGGLGTRVLSLETRHESFETGIIDIMIQSYKDLDVYQDASELFPQVYQEVRSWDYIDQKELGSQMIRAANSVHANLAEGYCKSTKNFKRYILEAVGSVNEMESHLVDAHNVDLIDDDTYNGLSSAYEIVGKQLTNLRKSL